MTFRRREPEPVTRGGVLLGFVQEQDVAGVRCWIATNERREPVRNCVGAPRCFSTRADAADAVRLVSRPDWCAT